MSDLRIAVHVDRDERAVDAGTTAGSLFGGNRRWSRPGSTGRSGTSAHVVEDGEMVEPVALDSDDGRMIMRHSTAHVLAQAVQDLFPEAKLGIGPPIENGFYYDFDVAQPFHPEDLERIGQRMRQIVKEGQRFARRVVSDDEARAELKDEPYKLQIIDQRSRASDEEAVEVGDGPLTIYDNLDPRTGERRWRDLCRGPHVPSTRAIPAFKLQRSAGAYWRGSEQNPQLQRIYGTAWESKDALAQHLHMLEEIEKRDHRRLGVELDLFSFPDEIGAGLAVFHPKGSIVRRVMEEYSRQRHEEAGYLYVNSPHITKETLFEISGHLGWYAENMYPPLEDEGRRYYLKPMNCPFHILIYRSRGRSYRELPMPLFEFGTVYRYEKSGVLHGLTRVRGLTMDDAHIFCTPEQLEQELGSCSALSSTSSATSASATSTWSCRPATRRRRSSSAPSRSGRTPPRHCAGPWSPRGWTMCWTRAGPPSTAPRSRSRAATPSAGPGSCPPSSSTSSCRSGSSSSTRRPTAHGSARS